MLSTLSLAVSLAAALQQPAMPDWLAGCWEARTGERWTEECWSRARAGMMIGHSRSGEGGVLSGWEVMQIVLEDSGDPAVVKLAFWAAPSGTNRTMFTWSPSSEPGVTFVNVANDYPQRIRYWREGHDLLAEISLGDGSSARRWRYRPVASGTPADGSKLRGPGQATND